MSAIRIKNMQSASPLIEQQFNEMQFVVDINEPDTTLKLSGAELKEAVGVQAHGHSIAEVEELQTALDRKLDKSGGTITGDLKVEGYARVKSLQVDEYLEVPELKYNRITATGGELWVTDAGTIDEVWQDVDGVYIVTLKANEDKPTINFAYKDILRGIFYIETGFNTAYFEVTGIVNDTQFTCLSLNDIAPERFMTLARQGNKTNADRQGSVYIDGKNKFLRVLDSVNSESIGQKNIKVQLGNLCGINHPIFGMLEGYGVLLENAYICGRLVQHNPTTGEDWTVGAVAVSGEQVFHFDKDGMPDKESIILTAQEFGITSTADNRAWQYKQGEQWLTIANSNTKTYTLRHDNPIWQDRHTLTIRYIVANTYYDIITVTKLYDGDDAYSVQILSDSGNNFINGNVATTLRAEVWRGASNITATIPESRFSWLRTSDNTEGDTVWNQTHEGIGSTLTLTDSDVWRKAVFECNVNLN